MIDILLRLSVAASPLFLTVVFAWLTMEGHLNFGGGEKDIFLAVPLMTWSIVFSLGCIVLWVRRAKVGRAIAVSSGFATAFVAAVWIVLFVWQWLKYR